MIEAHLWPTSNGRKITIMLEETGLEHKLIPVNLEHGDQSKPEFLQLSPNGKIPVIVDHENGLCLSESGAILLYLAEKSGSLIPREREQYWQMMQWLMFQISSIGPICGQVHHFHHLKRAVPYAQDRFRSENARLYSVLDQHLAHAQFLASEYSIADISTWPWISRFEWQEISLHDYPNLKRWYLEVAARPAVQRGYKAILSYAEIPMP